MNERKEKGIKIFQAEKKPIKVKVFQFTKDMLPEINLNIFKSKFYYTLPCKFNSKISFYVEEDDEIEYIIKCFLKNTMSVKLFEVGDYIGEDREGNYFVIKKEEFKKDWVAVKVQE